MQFNSYLSMSPASTQSWAKESMGIQRKAKLFVIKSLGSVLENSVFFQHSLLMDISFVIYTKGRSMLNDLKLSSETMFYPIAHHRVHDMSINDNGRLSLN